MVVVQPGEEVQPLLDLLAAQLGRSILQLSHQVAQPLAHGPPILDCQTDLLQHPQQPGFQLAVALGGLFGDLDMDEGLPLALAALAEARDLPRGVAQGRDDGVDDQRGFRMLPRQSRRHGVDQERHVVVDDLHHRVGGLPAVLFLPGGVDPHLRARLGPLAPEIPEREGRAVKVLRRLVQKVHRRDAREEMAREGLGVLASLRGHALVDHGHHLGDEIFLRLVSLLGHEPDILPPFSGRPRGARPAALRSFVLMRLVTDASFPTFFPERLSDPSQRRKPSAQGIASMLPS